MSNEETGREESLTRRKLIKTAKWIVPAILAVQLTKGDVFVHASSGGETLTKKEFQGLER